MQDKGKGKGLPAEPIWNQQNISATPSPPAVPEVPQHPAQTQLKSLVSEIQKSGLELTPKIKKMLEESATQSQQQECKDLHKAVARLSSAKKALQQVTMGRNNLHTTWKSFLDDSVVRWEENLHSFGEQDNKFAEEIALAMDSVSQAKKHLEEVQKQVTEDRVVNLEDDEEEMSVQLDAGHQIREGMQGMLTGLQNLKSKAEQDLQEQMAKKARTNKHGTPGQATEAAPAHSPPGGALAGVGGVPSASMVPFGNQDFAKAGQ